MIDEFNYPTNNENRNGKSPKNNIESDEQMNNNEENVDEFKQLAMQVKKNLKADLNKKLGLKKNT